MSMVQVQAQLSTDELVKAAEQLSQSELEEFTHHIIELRAQRQARRLPHTEAELLVKINQGLPSANQKRYDALLAKRRAETLTAEEHQELLQLTDELENTEARRVEYLSDLANQRKTSLTTLMRELGIATPTYA